MKDISSSQKSSKTKKASYRSIVTLVPLYNTDRSSFIQMCVDYNTYLSRFSSSIPTNTKESCAAFADKVISRNSEHYVDMLYAPHKKKAIGFIIYSENVYRSNRHFDYFIDELYVLPKYQSKGFGQAAMKRYMANVVAGKLGLYVLKGNERAYDFWYKFFSLQNISLDKIPSSDFDNRDTNLFCCTLA